MTTSIERRDRLDAARLDGEFYLASLLTEAGRQGLLGDAELTRIQGELFGLLRGAAERYTKGESSSIPTETAKALLSSLVYTIGIRLKTFPTLEGAVLALREGGMEQLYREGRKRIGTKVKTARLYHVRVAEGMVSTGNMAYNDTLLGGIGGFFKLYDPNFGAEEVHITVDYPLCNPLPSLAGIEFIQRYLEAVKLENDFCGEFSPFAVERLLARAYPHSDEMIFNICFTVLAQAIGCVLAGKEPRELALAREDVRRLGGMLGKLARPTLEAALTAAAEKLWEALDFSGGLLRGYMTAAVPRVWGEVAAALAAKRLARVFVETC